MIKQSLSFSRAIRWFSYPPSTIFTLTFGLGEYCTSQVAKSSHCLKNYNNCTLFLCIAACAAGTYGPNCTGVCGRCKGGATCDHVTGSCPSAECEPGWKQTTDQKCDTGIFERTYHLLNYFFIKCILQRMFDFQFSKTRNKIQKPTSWMKEKKIKRVHKAKTHKHFQTKMYQLKKPKISKTA
jgi:hypothetical protein